MRAATAALLDRYGSVNVPITALGSIVYGTAMLIAPARLYAAPGFTAPFEVLPQRAWGALFILAGALVLLVVNVVTVGLLAMTLCVWAALVMASAFSAPGASPSGWVWPAVIAAQLVVSVSRRGIGPATRARLSS